MPRTVGPVWIVQPGEDIPVPPSDAHPEHPIVLPPDIPPEDPPGIWGGANEPFPTPPIFLPGDKPKPPGTWGGAGEPFPTPPIVIPPVDGGGSTEPSGEPTFYQRKTLGINWSPDFDPSPVVDIKAAAEGADPITVRTVANDGTSSVTYPQDFTGSVTIQVVGTDGYLEGTTTVQ